MVDWWIRVADWWSGGVVDWWIGVAALAAWWIGGLVDWYGKRITNH